MSAHVSIVTPMHNSAATIAATLDSVRAQTFPDWECLVVDDGSSDEGVAIARGLASQDTRIKVVHNQRQPGPAGARNTGIEMANGRYVAFLDSDDRWLVRKLETQVSFMESEESVFSYGDYEAVDTVSGQHLGVHTMPEKLDYRDFLYGCPIGCLTVAFDQHALGKIYMPNVRRGQDWGLWLGLTRDGAVARRYPGCEAVYSVGGGSLSSSKLAKAADIYRIYRHQERIGPLATVYYMVPHIWGALAKRPES